MSVSAALDEAKRNIVISLRALEGISSSSAASSSSSSSIPLVISPLLPGLHESLGKLLSQLHHEVTALSLSFKPPITVPAAKAQLTKVHETYGRASACVLASPAGGPIGALVDEWRDGVESIGNEVQRLLDVFARQDAVGGNEDNPYLMHTGLVWGAIDKLKDGLSGSEVAAVEKRWRAQGEVLRDAWTEFKEFLEDQDEEDEDDESDTGAPREGDEHESGNEDDYGDEDGFGELEDMLGGKKMTPLERARAEKARSILGLHQILHSTVPRYLPLLVLDPEETYTDHLQSSSNLTAAFDGAVSAMYPEQDEDEIQEAISDLNVRSRKLVESIRHRLDRSQAEETKKAACRSFLAKWEDRLALETTTWSDKALSVSSLERALPE